MIPALQQNPLYANKLQNHRLLYLLAFIKFLLPFLLQNSVYELQRDEFLYLAEAHHMDWGYMEVPPLLSVFAWISNLFGSNMFWVKFWPSLFGTFTFIITGKTILSLGGKRFALILAFLPFIFTGYLRVHYLFQPNFLEIFFWTMLAWSIICFIQSGRNLWLYIFGISAGLGMLSKYSVAFFILSLLGGLALTQHRKIFTNRHFYYAALFALLIFLPNALWQYYHHFPVVFHMKKLQETQLQYISPLSFMAGQLIMFLPCFFIWLAGLFYTAKDNTFRFIGYAYIFVIILLIALHGKDYYSLGVYPVLFAFGSYYLELLTANRLKFLRYVFIFVSLVLGLITIPVALPVASPQKLAQFYKTAHIEKTGALKWEDLHDHPLPQDFADMLGWEEAAQKVAKVYTFLDSNEKKQTIIFCDNYGLAGAVNYYAKEYHLPAAYSDNASFLYWIPRTLQYENLIVVTPDKLEMQHEFIKDFKSAQLIDSISNPFARERGSLIILLKGADDNFKRYLQNQISRDNLEIFGEKK